MGRPRLAALLTLTVVHAAATGFPAHAAPLTQMATANAAAAAAEPAPPPNAPAPVAPVPPATSPTAASGDTPPPLAAPVAAPAPPVAAVAPAPGPVPTSDATAAPSDHDAVVGHWGIQAGRVSTGPYPLTLRPDRGCPSTATAPCTVDLGMIGVRHWMTRNLAVDVGVALAIGGGKEGSRTLDSYAGGGPQVGLALLLGNWRHLAITASPQLGVFVFKPGGGSTTSTWVVNLRAALEGELHFGFVGIPALSVGIASGLGFRYESTPDASVWSIGVDGPQSAWGVLTDLFVRYYL